MDVAGTSVGEGIIVSVGTGVEEAGGRVGVGLSAAGTHADSSTTKDTVNNCILNFIILSLLWQSAAR